MRNPSCRVSRLQHAKSLGTVSVVGGGKGVVPDTVGIRVLILNREGAAPTADRDVDDVGGTHGARSVGDRASLTRWIGLNGDVVGGALG